MIDDNGDRSWIEYRRLVLSELQRLEKQIDGLEKGVKDEDDILETKLTNLMDRIAELERKNTYRGGMYAAVAGFGALFGWLLSGGGAAITSFWDALRGVPKL